MKILFSSKFIKYGYFVLAVFLTLSWAPHAQASQIHVMTLELSDLVRESGFVLGIIVTGINAKSSEIQAKVESIWKSSRDTEAKGFKYTPRPGGGVSASKVIYKKGQDYDFLVHHDTPWTDPNQSPIEQKLRNSVSLEQVKKGDRMLLVGKWLLIWNTEQEAAVKRLLSASE